MLLCLLLAPLPVLAQFKCTMPNGVVVVSRLSPCPADAVKSVGPDGAVTYGKPHEYKPPPPSKPFVAEARPPEKPRERDIVSEAHGICLLLKSLGATTCDVNVNVFTASFIDATVATTPRDAQKSCEEVSKFTHQPDSPFIGRGWQLKIFSPLGSGTRPIAVCAL